MRVTATLRLLIGTMLVGWGAGAAAQVLPPVRPLPQAPWADAFHVAERLRVDGHMQEAADLLPAVLASARQHTESGDPDGVKLTGVRLHALLVYGDVLMRLGRAREAVPVLHEALGLDQQDLAQRSGHPDLRMAAVTYVEAAAARQAYRSLTVGNVRHFAQTLDTPDGAFRSRRWAERLPEVTTPALLLADAYSRLGDREHVLQVFAGPFRSYLQRQSVNPLPQWREQLALAKNVACLRIFLSLSRLGSSPQAEEAFQCARDPEFRVEHSLWRSPGLVDSAAARRRLVMGAYATYIFSHGTPDPVQRHTLLEAVADSKAAASRYRERLRSIWMRSSHPGLFRLRPRFDQLERAMLELPTQGAEGLRALAIWAQQEQELYTQALPILQEEGLMNAFVPGARILDKVQETLRGEDNQAVVMGYVAYRPVDRDTHALLVPRVFRYVLTGASSDIQDIGQLRDIEVLVGQWRSEIARGASVASAAQLSQLLLRDLPLEVRTARDWVIDADAVLALVPFEALLQADGRPVLQDHAVRYVTSLAAMAQLTATTSSGGPSSAAQTALVVGDPDFSQVQLPRRGGLAAASARGFDIAGIPQLPDTRIEALAVASSLRKLGLRVDTRLGTRATLQAFEFSDPPRFLHVATHGVFLGLEPEETRGWSAQLRLTIPGLQSALVLAAHKQGALLTGADLARLPLQGTELVVLSACDTGNGVVDVGEGVLSLRRAIEEAGARSSLTSLWAVPSAATAELMTDFYARVARGLSKAQALRQAKLHAMKTNASPLYWAGFLLAGAD